MGRVEKEGARLILGAEEGDRVGGAEVPTVGVTVGLLVVGRIVGVLEGVLVGDTLVGSLDGVSVVGERLGLNVLG